MKKIFLASKGTLVIDKIIKQLPDKPQNLKMVFIPTAAYGEGDPSWTEDDKKMLQEKGFQIKTIDITKVGGEDLKKELKQTDIIYVEGGNTFYLLQEAHKSGFSKMLPGLLEQGKIYIGVSAGSVVLGPSLEQIKFFDNPSCAPELKSYEGLGIINFIPFVHFGTEEYQSQYIQAFADFYDKSLVGMFYNDNQYVLVEDDKCTIFT